MLKIGCCYVVKFTKIEMPVRIESLETDGTWKARSLIHGRIVFVKSEAQILRECNEQDLLELAKTVMPNRRSRKQATIQKLPVEPPVAANERKPKATRPSVSEFSMTMLDAAHRVLQESKKPLASQAIVDLAFKKKYARSNGATPSNTLNAAIIREIGRLGDKARFAKVGRGLFTAR